MYPFNPQPIVPKEVLQRIMATAKMPNCQVYLNIGTIKTGSTFLQKEVFPKLTGIKYLHHPSLTDAVFCLFLYKKLLLSDERYSGVYEAFLPIEARKYMMEQLHKLYPLAKIIITLRTNEEEFVESNYNQCVHEKPLNRNHFKGTFKEFQALYNPNWNNHYMIEQELREYWDEVLILSYHELCTEPTLYVTKICQFMEVAVPKFKNIRHNIRKIPKKR